MSRTKTTSNETSVKKSKTISQLVTHAVKAQQTYATYSQEQVDQIVAAMSLAGSKAHI